MNKTSFISPIFRVFYQVLLKTRFIRFKHNCNSFSSEGNNNTKVGRVLVINLDRHDKRWQDIKGELKNIYDAKGNSILSITRRFSAIDARYLDQEPSKKELNIYYTLADQLFVDPVKLPDSEDEISNQIVKMSQQEKAVALSHLNLWRQIANEDNAYTLILEDDIFFRKRFSQIFDRAWKEIQIIHKESEFDILYLSYAEVKKGAKKQFISQELFKPEFGLWQLSGYVISKNAAIKLLEMLPINGPVDMWMNLQFHRLKVLATTKPIIKQRPDLTSSNSYSILPILAKVGVLTGEKPQVFNKNKLHNPVIAFGEPGSGLTSLAMALSILGYRCLSDIESLPSQESKALFEMKKKRIFESYVNIGSLTSERLIQLAKKSQNIYFVLTYLESEFDEISTQNSFIEEKRFTNFHSLKRTLLQYTSNVLVLPYSEKDKWELLCRFLSCDYPSTSYPNVVEKGCRKLSNLLNYKNDSNFNLAKQLKYDTLPWIVKNKNWCGIQLEQKNDGIENDKLIVDSTENFIYERNSFWNLRNDTFPSNLSIFRQQNFNTTSKGVGILTFQSEKTSVRNYTSAAIYSKKKYKYGKFEAVIKPSNVSGLITGVFLHRNSPRQEIDIEFLGKDTTKMLINVFYNPGCEGTKLEYGYRGTPEFIDLNFDASEDFHSYAIEWNESSIRWFIDDGFIYERANWDPTPIPHLPLEFNINLWYSRSKVLSGKISDDKLPSKSEIKSFCVTSYS